MIEDELSNVICLRRTARDSGRPRGVGADPHALVDGHVVEVGSAGGVRGRGRGRRERWVARGQMAGSAGGRAIQGQVVVVTQVTRR